MKIIYLILGVIILVLITTFSVYRPRTIFEYFQFKQITTNQVQATPNPIPSIRYQEGNNPKHTLDLYWPENEDTKTDKVLIFFHGGAWQGGDKSEYRFLGKLFAESGFFTVIPSYRLHPEVTYPDFLKDSSAAVNWIIENIETYGGNPQEIYLMGHSAGGHIVTMMGSDRDFLGSNFGHIKGVISIAGVHNLFGYDSRRWDKVFGDFARDNNTMPINHVQADNPKVLALHGAKDAIVDPAQSPLLVDLIKDAGGEATLKTYPQLNHFSIINVLHPKRKDRVSVAQDIIQFIQE